MTYYSADYLYPITSAPIPNGIIGVDANGIIQQIIDPALPENEAPASVQKVNGILIPGFINAHCHLELSHLVGKSQTGKTLLPFLIDVVTLREMPQEAIDAAIEEQDALMWSRGIQAVGDICNKLDTASTKRESPIRYYSFVEMFDFLQPERAEGAFAMYLPVYEGQAGEESGNSKSAVPHAPYTVSKPLYEKINALNDRPGSVSIHNQETPAEEELFRKGTGPFHEFFRGFGASLGHFTATGKGSIFHAMEHMDPKHRTLFVHNTLTDEASIRAAQDWQKNGVYWVTCPNANLYIENRLPRYDKFIATNAKVAVGTDSLTSNWQLCILEELRTISKYQSYVPLATLLQWATINGAEALQFDDSLGSLEVGKQPGLLQLQALDGNHPDNFRIGARTQVQRLV
jgi:cytosine/adenosine deaminase-related metal-dependent hydrolase